ncbi:MAG TPA: ATP-binding protein [Bryobacteraceae bacterium]|nr:ATP-binding protein [Bryobacteraceae bacterium]
MRRNAHLTVRISFWVLAALPVIICVLGGITVTRLFRSSEVLERSNETIRQLDKVYQDLSELEIVEREFTLTGDELALRPYDRVKTSLRNDLTELERLTSERGRHQLWISNLATLLDEKLHETERTIALRREQGADAATEIIKRRNESMRDIRKTVTGIRTFEQGELNRRRTAQEWNEIYTLILLAALLVLNTGLVWSLWLRIRHEAAEARREEARIREQNLELERRVQQRTEALQRSNEDLQQFAYVVSHDLKEPLRMVGSYTELLRRKYQGRLDGEADEYINFAVDGVRRMQALISDLLEYARAGEEQDKSPEPVDANEVLDTVLLNLQAHIDEAGATVTRDELPPVVTHQVWLSQLLQNLVANALKYRSEQPPRVHVSATPGAGETVFSVRDNGIGIDPKYKDQVFGVFKRLHGREFEGTGIGLATCKKIVERAGGRIWVESTPGEGSTFFFTVPQASPAPQVARAS